MRYARQTALAIMALVTAWSFWAWAQPTPSGHAPGVATAAQQSAEGAGAPTLESATNDESPPPMNWIRFGEETPPFVAMLVNFGILIGGYYYFGKKSISSALQTRRDTISKEIDDAQRMKHEAEERAKTYQAKLERLEDEVRAAREALARAAEAERDRIVADAEAKATRLRKDAEFLVEQELKQLRQDLWRDAVAAAVSAATDLLATKITVEDQQRLAEEYLADIGSQKPAAARAGEGGAS